MFDYKGWRKDKGLTQEQAAEQSGMSKSSWGRLERGQAVPEAFRIAADALVKGEVMVVIQQAAEKVTEKAEMIQTYSPHAIETREFAGQDLQVIRDLGDDEILLTDDQLGRALDYAHPGRSIANLAAAHLDELQNHYTFIDLMTVDGSERSVRVWREQGVYLLTMFSVQPKAKDFRQFAARTLYKVRRQQSNNSDQSNLETLAKLMGLRSEQALSDAKAYADNLLKQQTAELAEVKSAVAAAPSQAADEVLARMQALEAHKARLHDVVHSIVAKAKTLDQNDPDAQYWAQYANAWRSIHRYAQPPVSKLAGYTHPDQIEHAILGGEAILARLGGPVGGKQMKIEFTEATA